MSPKAGKLLVQEVAPRIRNSLAGSMAQVGADDVNELTQDGIAIAARLLVSAEARGKRISAGNAAFYSVRLVRQGRRSTGQHRNDVMHPLTQLSGHSRMVSMDAPLIGESDGEEIMCLHDLLAGHSEDPASAAVRHLDWECLLPALDARTLAVLICLVHGQDLTTLVPKMKRSRSAIQNDKERLAQLAREHLGDDVLRQVQELPRWTNDLTASRERCACRAERQAA